MADSFKDKYRDLQELVRELFVLRRWNLRFKDSDSQAEFLLFAEGAIVLVVLERFLRAILGARATEKHTLYNLLQIATSGDDPLLRLPADDTQLLITQLKDVRNTILHGNFEQASQQAKCANVAEFFKTQFAAEIERLTRIVDALFKQIDPETGRRYGEPPAGPECPNCSSADTYEIQYGHPGHDVLTGEEPRWWCRGCKRGFGQFLGGGR